MIVGLGNPGRRYAGTRHNVGFLVVDELARAWRHAPGPNPRLRADVAEGRLGPLPGTRVVLAKPLTFMNDSGAAVAGVLRFYSGDLRPADRRPRRDRHPVRHPAGEVRRRRQRAQRAQVGPGEPRSRVSSLRVRVGVGRPSSPVAAGSTARSAPRCRPSGGTRPDWVLSDFSRIRTRAASRTRGAGRRRGRAPHRARPRRHAVTFQQLTLVSSRAPLAPRRGRHPE